MVSFSLNPLIPASIGCERTFWSGQLTSESYAFAVQSDLEIDIGDTVVPVEGIVEVTNETGMVVL